MNTPLPPLNLGLNMSSTCPMTFDDLVTGSAVLILESVLLTVFFFFFYVSCDLPFHKCRMYSRYFYTNASSGESQWEYPVTDEGTANAANNEDEDSDDSDDGDSSTGPVVERSEVNMTYHASQSAVSSTTDVECQQEQATVKMAQVVSINFNDLL